MDPVEEKLLAELERERKARNAEAEKLARANPASKEEFMAYLRRTHGSVAPAEKPAPTPGLAGDWVQRLRAMLLRFALPATALLVVGLIVWSSLTPAGIVFPADPSERGIGDGGKPVLPDHIRVDFDKQRIEFFGGGDKLTGSMTEVGAESSPDVQAYQVTVKGKDAKGLEGAFDGRALFTRAKSGAPIRQKIDVKKIEVRGDLRISGLGSFPVKRTYLP